MVRMREKYFIGAMFIVGAIVAACQRSATAPAHLGGDVSPAVSKKMEWKEPKTSDVDPAKQYVAVIKTSKGEIRCELFAKDAPLSVTNFRYLANNRFYDGLTFHRVVPDFVVQGGDPTGTGAGGPGYTIPAEIGRKHGVGGLAWARTGDEVNPERRSSGSQFYITLASTEFLDGAYTVFGKTIEGMDVVQKIARSDVIESIRITEK